MCVMYCRIDRNDTVFWKFSCCVFQLNLLVGPHCFDIVLRPSKCEAPTTKYGASAYLFMDDHVSQRDLTYNSCHGVGKCRSTSSCSIYIIGVLTPRKGKKNPYLRFRRWRGRMTHRQRRELKKTVINRAIRVITCKKGDMSDGRRELAVQESKLKVRPYWLVLVDDGHLPSRPLLPLPSILTALPHRRRPSNGYCTANLIYIKFVTMKDFAWKRF